MTTLPLFIKSPESYDYKPTSMANVVFVTEKILNLDSRSKCKTNIVHQHIVVNGLVKESMSYSTLMVCTVMMAHI